jgi:ClpP class serine protease
MTRQTREREALRDQILSERAKILGKLEKERESKVITLIHRREPWIEHHDGEEDGIIIEDSEKVLMEIHRTPKERPIDMILHTPGGLQLAAEMIAAALRKHPARVTAIVPFYAMSGGSMIALAADEILMETFSVLGPLDPQVAGMASGALMELLEKKPIENISDEMIILADLAKKSIQEVKIFIAWFLEGKKMDEEQRKMVADFLTGGYMAHTRPLSVETLMELQLPVKIGVPELVFTLFETYEIGSVQRPKVASFLW